MQQVELPQIGSYTPVRSLGEGSTTYTHLYKHEQRKKYAVVKLTRSPLVALAEKEAFLARAELLKKLKHRNIAEVLDCGLLPSGDPADDYGYLVIQYAQGSPLRERFIEGQSYPPDEVRRVLFPLADALKYAEARHIIHGNLHPGNVMQVEKDFLLTDFSLPLSDQETQIEHTRLAYFYRAPEHLRDQLTAASDQYALAVMTYEWLCGRRPYQARTTEELLFQQENEPIPAPSSLNPNISPLVEQTLLRALALNPAERFPQTLTFADTYLRALMGLPPSIQTTPPVPILQKLSSTGSTVPETPQPVIASLPATPKPKSKSKSASVKKSLTPVTASQAEPVVTVSKPPQKILTVVRESTPEIAPSEKPVEQPVQKTQALITPSLLRTREPATSVGQSDLQQRVESDLRQGGVLSLSLQDYEERPAQIEMSTLVAQALTKNTPAVIEASTGTGKSLAYLIPVVRSGKVAIISTANKALQEQLFFKDIPFIQKYLRHFDAALVKGMSNYICMDRVDQEHHGFQHYVKNKDFTRLLERIAESDEDFTGDFETLGFALPTDIRSKVSADREQCSWSKCSFFSDCYVRKMKNRAGQASVIVVNHTLLLLDALMEGFLLPERDVIVIDEAHHLEEEATRAFTVNISQGQIANLLAQHLLKEHTQPSLQEEAREAMTLAWEQLLRVADPGYKGRANLKEPIQEGLHLARIMERVADGLRTGRPKDMGEKDDQLYDKLLSRAQNLADDIRTVFSVDQPGKYVYYVERVNNPARRGLQQFEISAAPMEVTSWLKEQLFDKSNVICTSATLATIGPDPAKPDAKGPNFAYFRRRVGLSHEDYPALQERILPLTFDYHSQALLYLPRHLPEPAYGNGDAAQRYTYAIGQEMMKLVEASRGRAFLLFSSKRMLDEVYEIFVRELPAHLKFPLLRQGDTTRMELVQSFRQREGAVLFGLKSFWEGVDIAGEALSLVVIDKLPFDPPDDPVHEARVAEMKAAGENWFGIYVLPQTVLRLKQGLGRLLRAHDDRGVMAILDTRLYTKSYGKQIVQALPPARHAFSIERVVEFFQNEDEDD